MSASGRGANARQFLKENADIRGKIEHELRKALGLPTTGAAEENGKAVAAAAAAGESSKTVSMAAAAAKSRAAR